MIRFIGKHSIWLVMLGFVLLSMSAYAQTGPGSSTTVQVDYLRDVATGAIGLVLMLVGWYAKSLETRLTKLEDAHNKHELLIAREYHDANDVDSAIKKAIDPVMSALHDIKVDIKTLADKK